MVEGRPVNQEIDWGTDPLKMDCSSCDKEVEVISGYGLAGGGIGIYFCCAECGLMLHKDQDPEMEE